MVAWMNCDAIHDIYQGTTVRSRQSCLLFWCLRGISLLRHQHYFTLLLYISYHCSLLSVHDRTLYYSHTTAQLSKDGLPPPPSPAHTMASSTDTARDDLHARSIPHMTLSTGDTSSMTGPPPPMPHYLTSEGRAIKRFAVEGNAICTSTHVSMVPHLLSPSPPKSTTLTRSLSSHRRCRNPCPRKRSCST